MMPECPCCGSYDDVEDTDYIRDDDGVVWAWIYECNRCGCKFKHYTEEKIIEDGNKDWDDEEEEDE